MVHVKLNGDFKSFTNSHKRLNSYSMTFTTILCLVGIRQQLFSLETPFRNLVH